MEKITEQYLKRFDELEEKAKEIYPINHFPSYNLVISARNSATIGSFIWRYGGGDYEFFLNAAYLATNTAEDIDDVIVHEFCHFLAHLLYGDDIRPHGKEWKQIMREFGGFKKPRSTSKVKNRAEKVFFCGCKFHEGLLIDKICDCCNQEILRF